jgi:hypothetical protein
MPAPGQSVSRLNTQAGGARIATQRLGRPQVWSWRGVGVRRPACKRARDLAHGAWRVHPVTRDGTDAAGATECGVLRIYLHRPARDKAQPALTVVLLDDGEPRTTDAPRLQRVAAASRAARLADGQA